MHEMAAARRPVAEALERLESDGHERATGVEIVLGAAAGCGGSVVSIDREQLAYVRAVERWSRSGAGRVPDS